VFSRSPKGCGHSGPGPKPGLSVDAIVDAAIAVADADGTEALSMRTVGQRLGRTAMALYTYVPSKRELLDLMYDRAIAELPGDDDLAAGWRAAATFRAGLAMLLDGIEAAVARQAATPGARPRRRRPARADG